MFLRDCQAACKYYPISSFKYSKYNTDGYPLECSHSIDILLLFIIIIIIIYTFFSSP
jgi:hypothetical protein